MSRVAIETHLTSSLTGLLTRLSWGITPEHHEDAYRFLAPEIAEALVEFTKTPEYAELWRGDSNKLVFKLSGGFTVRFEPCEGYNMDFIVADTRGRLCVRHGFSRANLNRWIFGKRQVWEYPCPE